MNSQSCWSAVVQPGVPCDVKFPSGSILNITGLSLDQNLKQPTTETGRVTLFISVNKSKPISLMSFVLGRHDSAMVNVILGAGDSAVLTTAGNKIPVRVVGCLRTFKAKSTVSSPAAPAKKAKPSGTAASKPRTTAATAKSKAPPSTKRSPTGPKARAAKK